MKVVATQTCKKLKRLISPVIKLQLYIYTVFLVFEIKKKRLDRTFLAIIVKKA